MIEEMMMLCLMYDIGCNNNWLNGDMIFSG